MRKKHPNINTLAKSIAIQDPLKCNYVIAKEISKLLPDMSPQAANAKISKNRSLRADLDAIRAQHTEVLNREIMPVAMQVWQDVLKDSDESAGAKFPYVKLAVDKVLRDATPLTPTINIGQIQAYIAGKMTDNS